MSEVCNLEWRSNSRFPHILVSEYGDVIRAVDAATRKAGSRIKGTIDADGYIRYVLIDNEGKRVSITAHQLVAHTYIGLAPSDRHEVAHNNGSKLANHYTNLRWATRKENAADQVVHETDRSGIRNYNAKLSEDDVRTIRREYQEIKQTKGRSVKELDLRFGVDRSTIVNIATRKTWKHVV